MKLYNVTYDLKDTSTILVPKIPISAADDEDKTTPRVCLADSLEHCLQALGSAYRDLSNGIHILVKEIDVNENSRYLKKPLTLKRNKKVPDALENNEYWYLKPIHCVVKECVIIDADTDFGLAWTCIPIKECRKIVSKYSSLNVKKYKNSGDLYNAFMDWANENKKWEEMDIVYEELAELPWAQKSIIENLKVKYI